MGVISAGFVPFRTLISSYPFAIFEDENGIGTYRCYKRILMPERFASKIFLKYLIGLYLDVFDRYIAEQGIPNIIHAHNCLYAGVAALEINKKYSIPYLITEHSSAFGRGVISCQQAKLAKEVLRNADVRTVVSTRLAEVLQQLFNEVFSSENVVFNILDRRFEERENVIEARRKNNNSAFTFLSIGSLDANKNHSDLLHAFANGFKGNGKVQLKIGGIGPLMKQLKIKAMKLGIYKQVTFTGLLNRDGVLNEMLNCDSFVLPSIYETFGVALIEALACGKPIVATKCGGPEDIVNKDNGIIVPAKNVDALGKAMESIYSNIEKYDLNQIRNDCLLRFGENAFVKRLLSIYASMVN